jgi:hypothetical protein
MKTVPAFSREQFNLILEEQHQLVEAVNNLELRLYQLGEAPPGSPSAECQVAAGVLIGQLRKLLFRWDQEVLPTLDLLAEGERSRHG